MHKLYISLGVGLYDFRITRKFGSVYTKVWGVTHSKKLAGSKLESQMGWREKSGTQIRETASSLDHLEAQKYNSLVRALDCRQIDSKTIRNLELW